MKQTKTMKAIEGVQERLKLIVTGPRFTQHIARIMAEAGLLSASTPTARKRILSNALKTFKS